MSEKKILKRSVFGGFKREDVLDYIEMLLKEILALKAELNANTANQSELDSLKSKNDELLRSSAELKEENEKLKAENLSLLESSTSLSLEIEELTVKSEDDRKKFEELENKYSELKAEYSKVSDVKEVSNEITCEADMKIKEAKNNILSAGDRLKTVCVNFESSSVSLKSCIENLISALDASSDKLNSLCSEDK